MRNIKFRLWFKKRKIMQISGICVGTGINGQYIINAEGRDWEGVITWIYEKKLSRSSLDDFMIMQYTGLKDINDKEIFEGDILKSKNLKGYGVVEYVEDKSCFMVKSPMNDNCFMGDLDNIEILGNIYKNPELLKETKKEKNKREIKFRVFDKKRKRILTDGICVGFGMNGYYIIDADDRDLEGDITWIYGENFVRIPLDNFIVMQNTGLKDVNGKEIFEGDIVKSQNMSNNGVVEYIEDKACFMVKESMTESHFMWDLNDIEVIGNVCENPELKEQK